MLAMRAITRLRVYWPEPDGRKLIKSLGTRKWGLEPSMVATTPPKEVKNMDWKVFLLIFGSVFIAELGDKTQLATMLFATDREISRLTVFIAASAALIVASALGVLAGSLLSEYINEKVLHYIAGVGFIAIGAYTLYSV